MFNMIHISFVRFVCITYIILSVSQISTFIEWNFDRLILQKKKHIFHISTSKWYESVCLRCNKLWYQQNIDFWFFLFKYFKRIKEIKLFGLRLHNYNAVLNLAASWSFILIMIDVFYPFRSPLRRGASLKSVLFCYHRFVSDFTNIWPINWN